MFVKFTQDVGSWAKDSVYDVEDDVARSFVSLKRATEVNEAEFLRASRKA